MKKEIKKAKDLLPSRDDLIRQAIVLWGVHGASWVTNVATYEALLEEKREKKIYPLNQMKKTEIAMYPKIGFMEIREENKAREYLATMNVEQLFHLVNDIEVALHSHVYVTIRNKIIDYRAEIKRKERGVNIYAVDPDSAIPSQKNFGKRGTANPEG